MGTIITHADENTHGGGKVPVSDFTFSRSLRLLAWCSKHACSKELYTRAVGGTDLIMLAITLCTYSIVNSDTTAISTNEKVRIQSTKALAR